MVKVKSYTQFRGRRAMLSKNVTLSNGDNNEVDWGEKTTLVRFDVSGLTAAAALTGMEHSGFGTDDNWELWAYFDYQELNSNTFTLKHEDSGSSAAKRIFCPKRFDSSGRDIIFSRGCFVHFIYMYSYEYSDWRWFVTNVSAD